MNISRFTNFLNKQNCQFFLLLFSLNFMLKLNEPLWDQEIFSDPDPGCQNLADPTDPDPKLLQETMNTGR